MADEIENFKKLCTELQGFLQRSAYANCSVEDRNRAWQSLDNLETLCVTYSVQYNDSFKDAENLYIETYKMFQQWKDNTLALN